MDCPDCGARLATFAVPDDLQEYAPDGEAALGLCTRCLRLHAVPNGDPDPDLTAVSGAMPGGEGAIPMAMAVGLLDSVALYRPKIAALFERVERAGADPFLVIDRLAVQGSIDPAFDIKRRRHQLEQLL